MTSARILFFILTFFLVRYVNIRKHTFFSYSFIIKKKSVCSSFNLVAACHVNRNCLPTSFTKLHHLGSMIIFGPAIFLVSLSLSISIPKIFFTLPRSFIWNSIFKCSFNTFIYVTFFAATNVLNIQQQVNESHIFHLHKNTNLSYGFLKNPLPMI